jgi:hypothetical protein
MLPSYIDGGVMFIAAKAVWRTTANHGTPEDVSTAKGILKNTEADAIDGHESVDQHEAVV